MADAVCFRELGQGLRCVDLWATADSVLPRLPYSFRILLENALRAGRTEDAVAIMGWPENREGGQSIDFNPRRLLMHDTTAVPALVDLATMRAVVAEHGGNPMTVDSVCPVHVSIDHSLSVDFYGTADAMARNREVDILRNAERYTFLKWADRTFPRLTVFPPGSGILHTINLEYLASVASRDGDLLVPDTMLGTDSHTPMINALGVLGWGVGGIEAESIMLGTPLPIRLPQVIGVHLTGKLVPGVLATDLALHLTAALRAFDVVDCFVEFYGPGVSSLHLGARAAIANMAPEYGATTGFFAIDDETLSYLRMTGRRAADVAMVEKFAMAIGLWHISDDAPAYSRVLEVSLDAVGPTMAGPNRPHDSVGFADIGRIGDAREASVTDLPGDAIALAAITSCTNTADLSMLVTAALLAKAAIARGMTVPVWVKTSFAPGSAVMLRALERAGLQGALNELGFSPVGIGCTTCIGNSGALAPAMTAALAQDRSLSPFAVLSGNRNFNGRIHPLISDSFLASPPLVVAFSIAGRLVDIVTESLGQDRDGKAVKLKDIWPSEDSIASAVLRAQSPSNVTGTYADLSGSLAWRNLDVPHGPLYPFSASSVYLRRPPFVSPAPPLNSGTLRLHLLAVYGDDVTTDHISPAGAIKRASPADHWLAAQHAPERNVFAAYRGNFEVMERGAFTAPALTNKLCPNAGPGMTLVGEAVTDLRSAAAQLHKVRKMTAIIAGDRYGQGSSRDWAAKAPALLHVSAILAMSFERIHRTNLVGMGIAPMLLPAAFSPTRRDYMASDVIELDLPSAPDPLQAVPIRLIRGGRVQIAGNATLACQTAAEVDLLRQGGIIPRILSRLMSQPSSEMELS
jgi:aconitate hydratase